MKSLHPYNFKASSITESVMAMTIIAICLSIAFMIYGKTIQTDHNIAFYKAQQKVKELLWMTKKNKSFEDGMFNFETYKIQKTVKALRSNDVYQIDFTIRIQNTQEKYQYIVSY